MTTIKANLSKALIRAEKQNGRDYLVAPVVLITEGVHNNIFYPAEELAKFPESWNGRPLPLGHPMKSNVHVSANTPVLIDEYSVGQVFNVNFEAATTDKPARLAGEVWIDTDKLKTLVKKKNVTAIKLAEALENDEIIEVSTGLFTDDTVQSGKFNGKNYTTTALNHRPDHLALLPGGEGACSAADGGGIRANEEAGTDVDDSVVDKIVGKVAAIFQSMLPKTNALTVNELTASDKRNTLDRALRQKLVLTQGQWFHIEAVADTYFVYEWNDDANRRFDEANKPIRKLIKRSYTTDASDQISIGNDPVEVARKTEFISQSPQIPQQLTANADQNRGQTMTPQEKVTAIIALDGNAFAASDEQSLLKLNEAQLDAMLTVNEDCGCKKTVVAEPKTNAIGITAEDVAKIVADTLKATVPTLITNAVKEATDKVSASPVLERLKVNAKCSIDHAVLETMTAATLTQLEQSLDPSLYDGKGAIRTNSGQADEIPATPSITGLVAEKQD